MFAVFYDELAVHQHVFDSVGVAVWFLVGGSVDYSFWVYDHDVGPHVLPDETSVP